MSPQSLAGREGCRRGDGAQRDDRKQREQADWSLGKHAWLALATPRPLCLGLFITVILHIQKGERKPAELCSWREAAELAHFPRQHSGAASLQRSLGTEYWKVFHAFQLGLRCQPHAWMGVIWRGVLDLKV